MKWLKNALALVAAAFAGFYLGGRYVGDLALSQYMFEKPPWLETAHQTLWVALAACAIAALAWIVLDYRES